MSRSFRKTPIVGVDHPKDPVNKKFRRRSKQSVKTFNLRKLPFKLSELSCLTYRGYVNPNSDRQQTRDYYQSGLWKRK